MKSIVTPEVVRHLVADHDDYWDDKRPAMTKLAAAYETRMWDSLPGLVFEFESIRIELSRAYEVVESFVASLYAHNPAVVVKGDILPRGDADLAALAANAYLRSIRTTIEDAARMALIYPMAFMKLYPCSSTSPLTMVEAEALPPWEVILDRKARGWKKQRYIGHSYWIPLSEAKARYGKTDLSGQEPVNYLEGYVVARKGDDDIETEHIRVVEMYFPGEDRYVVWSEHYEHGDKWLFNGASIEMPAASGEEPRVVKFDGIPVRSADDKPIVPIIPLYFNHLPYEVLTGYSTLYRLYDQIREEILIRTMQAASVRKAARQWFARKGAMDEDAMSKLADGQDGEIIEVDLKPDESISNIIAPVPHTETRNELQTYYEQVQSDLDRGSVMAPFTRGEATKATASEVTALAAYTASEVGRLARIRDGLIEVTADIYFAMLRMYLDKPQSVTLDGRAAVLTAKDLTANFSIWAQDGGSTPADRVVKRAEFREAVPTLLELGVPKATILKEYVRLMSLPADFVVEAEEAEQAAAEAAAAGEMAAAAPPEGPPAAQPAPGQPAGSTGLEPGNLPSPGRISTIIGDEGVK